MQKVISSVKGLSVLISITLILSLIPTQLVSARINSSPPVPILEDPFPPYSVESAQTKLTNQVEVPLITGDTVIVAFMPDGTKNYSILPAENQTGNNYVIIERPSDYSSEQGQSSTSTYAIPNQIDLSRFDIELFNIDYLIKEKYNELSYVPVIVVNKPEITPPVQTSLNKQLGEVASTMDISPSLPITSARFAKENTANAYKVLNQEEGIKKIWLDKKVHIDLNESVPLIGAPDVWGSGYTGQDITIAILDTGIDETHPDLDDLDDNPGTTDPKVLVEVNFTDDPTTDDGYGHGTHCASIAAGTGDTYTGVAPGAWLYNVKVLNSYGSGAWSWIISGIEYATLGPDGTAGTGDEADVISMSLGGTGTDGTDPVSQAVNWAVDQGVVVAISAGNGGADYFTLGSPGVANEVITVGATDKSDVIAGFSSRGPTIDFRVKPDVVAPGVNIVAARASGTSMGSPVNDYYTSAGGTSMAAPHVAGAAALILEANPTIPLGWDSPKFVKNTLMANAIGLGYDVYTQGAGRISLPESVNPVILVDPPTTSFGVHSGPFACEQELTFYNLDSVSHELTLSPELIEIISSSNLNGNVNLSPSVLTIPAGSSAITTLTVNTATLPKGMYSGRVEAAIDTGDSVQAIFGFSIANALTVNKIDMKGDPGIGHYVCAFSDTEDNVYVDGTTNDLGQVTLYIPDEFYQIASYSTDPSTSDVSVFTFSETTVIGPTTVTLDDRTTVPILFDPNKPNQVIADKDTVLRFWGDFTNIQLHGIWSYPSNTTTRVNPTSVWGSSYTYSFYPSQYYDPNIIDTPEWNKFGYGLESVTGPVTFVADYNDAVIRQTEYKTIRGDESARLSYWIVGPPTNSDWAYSRTIKVPVVRTEYFSPEPFQYVSRYYQNSNPITWQYYTPWLSYPSGTVPPLIISGHPFNSNIDYYLDNNILYVYGGVNSDSNSNRFYNASQSPAGHINITQDSIIIANGDINDEYIFWGFGSPGTPDTVITLDGWSGLDLSTQTQTILEFTANPASDYYAPEYILNVDSPYINLYNEVLYGNIPITIQTSDIGTGLATITLEYSIDNGTTWTPAALTDQGGGVHTTTLSIYTGDYVSLRVYLEDVQGNSRTQTTIRGFPLSSAWDITPPDGALLPAGQVDFDWEDITDATGYRIQIDTVDTFDSPDLIQADVTPSEYSVTINDIGQYYWRTKAYIPPSGETSYTPAWTFRLSSPVMPLTSDVNQDYYPHISKFNDGSLVVCWSRNGDIYYRSSSNNGITWSTETKLSTATYEYEPSMIQAEDGTIWLTWFSFTGSPDIWYRTSSDNGTSWSADIQLTTDPNIDYDPDIIQTADGKIWVVWESYRSGNPDIWYKTSIDNGTTWSADTQLTTDSSSDYDPEIIQTENGNIQVVWHSYRSGNSDIWCKTSSNNGTTWSSDTLLFGSNDPEYHPSITQTPDGTLFVTWYSSHSANEDIWIIRSSDSGITWTESERFTHFVGYDRYPAITSLPDNSVGIVWYSDRAGNYDIWFGIPGVMDDVILPPHVAEVWHDPIPNPDSDEIITIQARLADETGISNCDLQWYKDFALQSDLPMYNDGTHGDILAGDNLWSIQIGPFPAGTQINYGAKVTDVEGNTVITPSASIQFQILDPWLAVNNTLLVMDTLLPYYIEPDLSYYKDALDTSGISYDIWDVSLRGVPDTTELTQYLDGAVIWGDPGYYYFRYLTPLATGIWGHYHHPDNRDAIEPLETYLDNGGKLFISGSGLINSINNQRFLNDYLHASYVGYSYLYEVLGINGDPISDGLSLPLSNYGQEIDPVPPAVPIFTYNPAATSPMSLPEGYQTQQADVYSEIIEQYLNSENVSNILWKPDNQVTGIQSSGTAGVRVDTGTFRLVFLPFEFDSVSNTTGRQMLIERSLNWLTESDELTVIRDLPVYTLENETFEVMVTFTSPADGFNAIGLSDFSPSGWTVTVDPAWCSPTPFTSLATGNRADYLWDGPYTAGQEFSAIYQVTVPPGTTPGLYSFNGNTEYYIGEDGPTIVSLSGDLQVEVIEGARISGTTYEANGSILSDVTITINGGASVVSTGDGMYQIIATTSGNHTVTASKSGFRDQVQVIEITDLDIPYTLDFKGNYGLIPDAPDISYVLACINKWIAPPGDGTELNISKVLAVINAWKFPL